MLTCVFIMPQFIYVQDLKMNSPFKMICFYELHDMSAMICYMKFDYPERSCCIGWLRKCYCRMSLIFILALCILVSLTATVYWCFRQLWHRYMKLHAMETCCKLAMCSAVRSKQRSTCFYFFAPFFFFCNSVVVWICLPSAVQMCYWNAAAFTSRSQCWRMLQA